MNMHLIRDRGLAAADSDSLPPLRGADVLCVDGQLDCVSRKVRSLYDWWRRVAEGVALPDWSLFDVTEHKTVVANLYLAKRTGPCDWTFTVRGEGAREIFPRTRARGALAEMDDPETARRLNAHFDAVAASGRCHMVRGTILNDRNDLVDIESIDCPFIDSRHDRFVILGVIERIATRPPVAK